MGLSTSKIKELECFKDNAIKTLLENDECATAEAVETAMDLLISCHKSIIPAEDKLTAGRVDSLGRNLFDPSILDNERDMMLRTIKRWKRGYDNWRKNVLDWN